MEEFKSIGFLVADFLMVAAGAIYGWKFLKKKNYLLGLEWWIVAISGTNFFFWALAHDAGLEGLSAGLYSVAYYFDAFSRAFGFPVIAVAGLMAVTHFYRPSKLTDMLWFAGSFMAAAVLMVVATEYRGVLGSFGESTLVQTIEAAKPWFYLLMWTAYSGFLAYFAWRLFRVGERLHGWSMVVVMVSGQTVATIYDFFEIPGDDAEHTLFYILALSAWAFSLFAIYHAYSALERAQRRQA